MYLISQIIFFLLAAAVIGFVTGWSSGRRFAGVPALTAARDLAVDAKERLTSEVNQLREALKAAPNPGDLVRVRQQADELANQKIQAERQIDDLKARLAAAPTLADVERHRRETLTVRSALESQLAAVNARLAQAPAQGDLDRLRQQIEELTGQRAQALQEAESLRAQLTGERDAALAAKTAADGELARVQGELETLRAQPAAPPAELEALRAERDAAAKALEETRAQLQRFTDLDALRQARDAAIVEKRALETENAALRTQLAGAAPAGELDRLRRDAAASAADCVRLAGDLDHARTQLAMLLNADAMRRERDDAIAAKQALELEQAALREKAAGLDVLPLVHQERDEALARRREIEAERDAALARRRQVESERDAALLRRQEAEAEAARLRAALAAAPSRAEVDRAMRQAEEYEAQREAALRQVEELKAHLSSIEQWRDEAARAIEALRARPAPASSARAGNVVVIPSRAASMSAEELEDALSVAGAGLRPPALRSPRGAPDDLQAIRGLGARQEEWLNAQGVYHYWQIASLDIPGVAWLVANAPDAGSVVYRDNWVAQAARLAREHIAERA
ncbi:MAG: hypothetical protein AB7M12_04150 [Hyphomonadaceae bacterium]